MPTPLFWTTPFPHSLSGPETSPSAQLDLSHRSVCPTGAAGLLPNGIGGGGVGWGGEAKRWTRPASELRQQEGQAVVTSLEPLDLAGPEANPSIKLVSYGNQGSFL